LASVLLLIIAGRTGKELVNERPTPDVEGRKLVLTASVPGESPEIRVNLQPEQG
jgi:hypothetical protein